MLQTTPLTGISSPRFRRCLVGEETRALFQKFFSLLSCFAFSMIAPQTSSKIGVSHDPSVSKVHSLVLGIQILTPRRWGIQESQRVYEHLALKVKTIVSWPRSLWSNLPVRLLDTLPRSGIRSSKGRAGSS